MPTDFDEDLSRWRDAAPPADLKPRIAAALVPRPLFHLKPAFAALAACLAAVSIVLLWPGSPARPLPAFADVEKAMEAVQNVAYTRTLEVPLPGGKTRREPIQVWVRRNPPAIAQRFVNGSRSLSVGQRDIIYYAKSRRWKIHPRQAKIDLAVDVDNMLRGLAQPGRNDSRSEMQNWKISPWQAAKTTWNGHDVTKFTQTRSRKFGGKFSSGIVERETVWADAKTNRVVRTEDNSDFGGAMKFRQVSTDFRYNLSAPSGVFDLKPPPGTPTTKRKW